MLFGVIIKNVNVLEMGLAPYGLGKNSTSLFLNQIGDRTAYPRNNHHKTSESLNDFVEAVTDFHARAQSHKGETKDSGWKHKSCNALGNIKSGEDISAALP